MPLIISITMALAVGLLSWTLFQYSGDQLADNTGITSMELKRRRFIAEKDIFYRRFQTLVQEIAQWISTRYSPGRLKAIENDLRMVEPDFRWTAPEFIAVKVIIAFPVGLGVAMIFWLILLPIIVSMFNVPKDYSWLLVVMSGVLGAIMYVRLALSQLSAAARIYRLRLRLDLPYFVDLLMLVIDAGVATLEEALDTVVRETQGSNLSTEFARVQQDMRMGMPRDLALIELHRRVNEDDIRALVFALNTGLDLGTPLATILQRQVDQLRLRQSQLIEKLAAEAEVKMSFPSFLSLLACLLVVATPFILDSISQLSMVN
jgi:Flp pilus assembly protein TadB